MTTQSGVLHLSESELRTRLDELVNPRPPPSKKRGWLAKKLFGDAPRPPPPPPRKLSAEEFVELVEATDGVSEHVDVGDDDDAERLPTIDLRWSPPTAQALLTSLRIVSAEPLAGLVQLLEKAGTDLAAFDESIEEAISEVEEMTTMERGEIAAMLKIRQNQRNGVKDNSIPEPPSEQERERRTELFYDTLEVLDALQRSLESSANAISSEAPAIERWWRLAEMASKASKTVDSASDTPSLSEELEGFVQALTALDRGIDARSQTGEAKI